MRLHVRSSQVRKYAHSYIHMYSESTLSCFISFLVSDKLQESETLL